jgi:MFS family permease
LCTQWSRGASFLTSAAIFFIYGLVFIAMLLRDQRPVTVSKPAIPFRDVLGILKKDNLMILHIVGGVLVTLVFAQITSTFAQFAKLEIPNGIWLYSTVLTINTVLVLVLQVPMSRATKNIGLMRQVMLGCLLYSVGFILMGSAKISPLLAVLGIAVITSGEVIIVPTGSTLVDALAPGELKAAYFGAAQMRMSGMFIGPIVGGFLYERIGGASSFLIMAGLSFVAALIYLHGSRAFALTSKAGNMISRIEARKHPTQEEAPS